jgi:uncharacterized protein DUF5658
VLNFLDVVETLAAMKWTAAFDELNPLASSLFTLQFGGFVVALLLKYSPIFLLAYIVFIRDDSNRRPLAIRLVKFGALVALAAGNIFYVYVVGSNLGNILRLFF